MFRFSQRTALTTTEFFSDELEPNSSEGSSESNSAEVDFFRLCKLVVSVIGLPVLVLGIFSEISTTTTGLLLITGIGGLAGYFLFNLSERKQ